MAKGYDSLNDTFNTDDNVEVDAIVKTEDVIKPNDVNKDYDYTRGNLYSLIEKVKKQSMALWKLLVKLQVQGHMKLLDNLLNQLQIQQTN